VLLQPSRCCSRSRGTTARSRRAKCSGRTGCGMRTDPRSIATVFCTASPAHS
jgi:hypothetical protein